MPALRNNRVVRGIQTNRALLLFNCRIQITILLSVNALTSELQALILDLGHEAETHKSLHARQLVLALLRELVFAVANDHGSGLAVLDKTGVRAKLTETQEHDEDLMVVLEDRAGA